jgi:N-acetylated-alpha-linked acidic dipeptidase
MRKLIACLTLCTMPAFALNPNPADSTAASASGASLRGYTAAHSAAEIEWEKKFRAIPEPDRIRENMRRLSARPHHVGSPYDRDNAEWLLAQLKSYGLDAKIETFSTLFPTPKSRKLELLWPTPFTAKLQEPAVDADPTSNQKDEQLPTYNAFSRDGDVTAPLVYVNYGAPDDYKQLESMGVSVKGAIVLARYGMTWRGIKPKLAAEHGAVGCLIYSDPRDDGYSAGDVFPQGAMRPVDGVQRGSVMDMPVYPGDPQTPGVGSVEGVKLIPIDQVETITKIPVLPISYGDAKPFLMALKGEMVPESWRGGLPIPYKTGPSETKAHLALAFNWDRKPLYDVVARIPGSTLPDEWVIRGNHHDAWVNGAEDPLSGTSPELEEARALGELLKQGWHPQRTVIYCFWDGEEPALLGSTEWAETHAKELSEHAVAYFNTDGNGRGFFGAEGSHSLENFIDSVTSAIDDPETGMSVHDRAKLAEIHRASPEERATLRGRADTRIPSIGSGSDFSVFIDHLGVASVNLGFGGEDEDGQYHSIYDDFYLYSHFADTTFVYGRALAQTVGTMVVRMADADVIPFQFADLADTLHTYVGEVKKLAETERAKIKETNTEIADGTYKALTDPKKTLVPPVAEPVPPYFNFAPLDQASDDLTNAAADFEKAYTAHGADGKTAVNPQLIQTERVFLDPAGLPKRSWYGNLIYAPGLYTGYGVKTLPAVREAIEQKQWPDVEAEIVRTAAAMEREAALLKAATQTLNGGQ